MVSIHKIFCYYNRIDICIDNINASNLYFDKMEHLVSEVKMPIARNKYISSFSLSDSVLLIVELFTIIVPMVYDIPAN